MLWSILILCLIHQTQSQPSSIILDAGSGLQWKILQVSHSQYAIGQPLLDGSAIAPALDDAVVYVRRISDKYVVPLLASNLSVARDKSSAILSGSANLPLNSSVTIALSITLLSDFPAAEISLAFESPSGLKGWQICVKWIHDGATDTQWRLHGYPRAGNTTRLDSTTKLDYFGWPGFWVYRPDASIVAYFALDIADDFSNPTTWTGATTFGFQSENGYQVAPQFMFGGAGMDAGQVYETAMTLHFVQRQDGDMLAAVRSLVPALLKHSNYRVEPMPTIRTPSDSLACFLNARKTTPMWSNTPNGTCYELQQGCGFCYLGTTPESAYFEYQIYKLTNETLWRNRAFSQMAFWLQGQNLKPADHHYGVVHTTYDLPKGPYNSEDRGTNVGWKIDLNSHMARYALLLWQSVLETEGVNMTTWYTAAQLSAQWIYRMAAAQGGAEVGLAGFPQRIVPDTDLPTPSVVSGRTMNALSVFQRLLGDTSRYNYTLLRQNAEAFLQTHIEGLLFFSGQHPDLEWWDYEQDSIWELVEYWLNVAEEARLKNEVERAEAALERAVGDAYIGLLMLCPKQLSWVDNPTQLAADEQEQYDQYTVYTYHNKKWLVIQKLANITGENLWQQVADRLFQLNMFTQGVKGGPDAVGGYHEAIADPWLARGGGYNFVGSVYLNELALDLSLQMIETGVKPTVGYTQCVVG